MSEMTILIVDDDPEITDALARGLKMHGYSTLTASTVEAAEMRFGEVDVTAAIVDVMVGPQSGIDLVRRLRQGGNTKPILMLSAMAEVEDRAAGLAAGADDYIVKPFAFDELVARLKVQQHRAGVSSAAGLKLERNARSVQLGGRSVQLTEREFTLIELLYAQRGRVLSRGEIFDQLWASEGTSSENVVDVYIGYLRKKLAPITDFGIEIKTIRSKGFALTETERA
jgi:DNA-binding response OmpR family regulator